MELIFKFNATRVDEIEQTRKKPLEECIADTTVSSLATFLQKALVDDNGQVGVSRTVAFSKLDEYLAEKDKDELMLDIMEALTRDGFLSREIDVSKMRELKTQRVSQALKQIDNSL